MNERMTFKGLLPKVTKENSACIHGRVILFLNKRIDGTKTQSIIAYDLLTKIQLGVNTEGKEALIKYLKKQDFERIENIEGAMNEKSYTVR